jgi:hypothetical protein
MHTCNTKFKLNILVGTEEKENKHTYRHDHSTILSFQEYHLKNA